MRQAHDDARRAYEAAKAHQRGYYERFYPVKALGSRPAEPVTPEALAEIARLEGITEGARIAWEQVRREPLTP